MFDDQMFAIAMMNRNIITQFKDSRATDLQRNLEAGVSNLTGVAPLNALFALQNAFYGVFQGVGVPLNAAARILYHLTGSEEMNILGDKLPRISNLLCTVTKIIAFAAGTVLAVTVGILAPQTHFDMHLALAKALHSTLEKFSFQPLSPELR